MLLHSQLRQLHRRAGGSVLTGAALMTRYPQQPIRTAALTDDMSSIVIFVPFMFCCLLFCQCAELGHIVDGGRPSSVGLLAPLELGASAWLQWRWCCFAQPRNSRGRIYANSARSSFCSKPVIVSFVACKARNRGREAVHGIRNYKMFPSPNIWVYQNDRQLYICVSSKVTKHKNAARQVFCL